MLTRRAVRKALAFAIAVSFFSTVLHAAEPARRWRPATAADLPAGTQIQPAGQTAPGQAITAADSQRVHIDPASGAIVPAPADARAEAAASADIDAAAPPLVLRQSPTGVLYVDTTGYQHTATVTLDAQGQPQLDCEEPPQDAAAVARLAQPGMPRPEVAATAANTATAPQTAQRSAAAIAAAAADRQQRLSAAAGSGAPPAAKTATPTPASPPTHAEQ